MGTSECLLRVRVGDSHSEFGLFGHPVLNRISAKRFTLLINERLIAAALSLIEASAIYSAEEIQKSRPRSWRDRFINEQMRQLEMLTAKPKDFGRPRNSRKDCLRKEDEKNELARTVILAVLNLYHGKSDDTYQCQHHQGLCPGHDVEEIDIPLVAQYLNMKNPGTLRNRLSKNKLRFPKLREAAREKITN